MVEATDAKDMIDEAIERAEDQRTAAETAERIVERRFRDRVSLFVGILAVSLAIVHMGAAGAARESLLKGIEASDTFNYMQAKIVREAIAKAAVKSAAFADVDRKEFAIDAERLRAADVNGHGIRQLQAAGRKQRDEGAHAAIAGERYELGETALQLAIVLLSIALVARSRAIVGGAAIFAVIGIAVASLTAAGVGLPWST